MYCTISRALKLVFVPTLLILAIALLALACGGGGSDDSGDNGGDGGDGPVSFDVSMGDNFFEPKEFTVKAGQKVTFNLTNDGAAIHSMRVAGADNEYNTEDDAELDPFQLAAGDTGTLEWTAPDEAGEIKFQCDFHPTDQNGTITVE